MISRTFRNAMAAAVATAMMVGSGMARPPLSEVASGESSSRSSTLAESTPQSANAGPTTPLVAGDATTFAESPSGEVTGDGRFVQRIPVSAPSFHGLEPNVGLLYDSRQGTGVAGWGWQLSGDSAVQRLARGRGAPRMDATDDFLLNGERLIPCAVQQRNGVSCQTGGTHSTERETFRRITHKHDSWMVWDRDGTRSTYVSWPGKAKDAVFAIAERRNSHGDTLVYHRWCDGTEACYLKEIEYLDAIDPAKRTRIVLHYEARPDPYGVGMGEVMVFTRYRLLTIEVRTGGKTASALALRYAALADTLGGRASQLDGVTRYGNDVTLDKDGRVLGGTALPTEAFGWPKPAGAAQTPTRAPLAGDKLQATDNGGPAYADSTTSTGLRLDAAPPGDPLQVGDKQFLVADVNGDGRSDHISVLGGPYRAKSGLPLALQVRLSNGDSTFNTVPQSTTWPITFKEVGANHSAGANHLLIGDVNGDGRADLVNVWWDSTTKFTMAEAALGSATGALTQQGAVTMRMGPSWGDRIRWFMGDHDGDGRDDLLEVFPAAQGDSVRAQLGVARSDGARFSTPDLVPTLWTFERRDEPHWFVGDADGDKRADVLSVESRSSGDRWLATLRLALSRGDGTFTLLTQPTGIPFESPIFTAATIPLTETTATGELAHSGDFDGDGRTDLVLVQRFSTQGPTCPLPVANCWKIRLTTAFYRFDGKFSLETTDTAIDASWMNTQLRLTWKDLPTISAPRWLTTDLDADGRTDLLLEGPTADISDPSAWPTTVRLKRVLRLDDASPSGSSWHAGPDELLPWPFWCHVLSPADKVACANGPTAHEVSAGDINGDGRGDFIYTGPENNTSWTYMVGVHLSPNGFRDLQRGLVADVTGDGRDDWVYVQATNPGLTIYTATAEEGGGMHMTRRELADAAAFTSVDMRRWLIADFGSPGGEPDGKADLLHLRQDTVSQELRFTLLFSVGLGNYAVVTGAARTGEEDPDVRPWTAADVNGDGAADLVRILPDGQRAVSATTLLADSRGGWKDVSTPASVQVPWPIYGPSRMQPADVDGDGWVDLAHVSVQAQADGSRQESVLTLRSNGAGDWTPKAFPVGRPTAAATGWQPTELNGDGRTDLVRVAYDKPSDSLPGSARVDRLLSRGRGAFEFDATPLGIGDHSPRWNSTDLNGDGCDELMWVNSEMVNSPGFGYVRRVVNTCATLVPEHTQLTTPVPTVTGWSPADRNENTTRQLLRMVSGAGQGVVLDLVYLPLGAVPRLMEATASGLGRIERITYGSSAGTHDEVPPGVSIAVVVAHTVQSGVASAGSTETRYSYAGLTYSYPLQRLLGFLSVDTEDNRKRVRTINAQTPACAGVVRAQFISTPQGKLLVDERTRYDDNSASPAPWTCQPSLTIRKECDGEANCRQQRTRQEHDHYGNVTVRHEFGVYVDNNRDGVDDTPDDNRIKTTGYVPNTDLYIVSLPAWTRTESGRQELVAERRLTYDKNTSYQAAPTVGDARIMSDLERHLDRYLATEYRHDAHGNVTTRIDPTGRATTTQWDPTYGRFAEHECNQRWCTDTTWDLVLGRPTSQSDPQQKLTTTMAWDPLGRHLRTDYPDGGCLAHQYLDWGKGPLLGQRISEDTCATAGGVGTNGLLNRTYHFDGLHRVHRDERSGGYTRSRTFIGNTTLVYRESSWHRIGAAATVTEHGYDALDRLLYTLNPDKSVFQFGYLPGVETRTDETNRKTTHHLDGLGRVTRVEETGTGAPAITTTLSYDALDQLESSSTPTGVTSREVGSLGWLWRECNPDSGCLSRTFDDAGRVETQTNAEGQRIVYSYETLGRLESKTYYDRGALVDRATWSYDIDPISGLPNGYSKGQITQTYRTSSSTRETRWYDNRGRLTQQQVCVGSTCAATETTWGPSGRVANIRYPDRSGRLTTQSEQVDYTYDAAGRPRSVGRYASNLEYTASDQLSHITYGNRVAEDIRHDPNRAWISQIDLSGMAGNWPTLSINYPHDPAGRITGEDRSAPVNHQKRYGYDAYGRLESESSHLRETYGYDALGRPDRRSTVGTYVHGDPNHPNAVTAAGGHTYTYDAAGRMKTGTNASAFAWDADGNLTGVTTNNAKITYGYDADGRRVVKEVPALLSKTIFAGPLVEIDDWGELKRSYVLGDRLLARSHWTWGGGGPADKPGVWYYHADPRRSVSVITDDTGRPIQYYDYEPYGTAHEYQPGIRDDIKFNGARQDNDTGLIHFGARDYDPVIGRFLSPDSVLPDPLRSATYDRYAYGNYDPVNTVDPSGHQAQPLEQGVGFNPISGVNISSAPRSVRVLDKGLRPLTLFSGDDTETQETPGQGVPFPPMSPGQVLWDLYKWAWDQAKSVLYPIGDRGKGFQIQLGGVACPVLCAMAFEPTIGVYFSAAGPHDLIFGEAHLFGGAAGAAGGVTLGTKGPELAAGLAGSLGIDFQIFASESRNVKDFTGWGRNYSGGYGPVSVELSVSPGGQYTWIIGGGLGIGFGVRSYNEYTLPLLKLW